MRGLSLNRWCKSILQTTSTLESAIGGETESLSGGNGCQIVMKNFGLSSVRSTTSSSDSIIPNVCVNQIVACVPTSEAREADKKSGYHLPFSLGRVVEVKGSGVVVTWLFARYADGVWRVWDEGKKGATRPRRDELDFGELLRDHAGVLNIQFCADKTLKKASLIRLKANQMLAMSEVDWFSFFRKPSKS